MHEMDEVWKDIQLPPLELEQPLKAAIPSKHRHPELNLQDLLARSFARGPSNSGLRFNSPCFEMSVEPGTLLPHPPPATMLSLNAPGSESVAPFQSRSQLQSHPCSGFLSFGASSSISCKRGNQNEEGTGDRRFKRRMKNRESAARSRARKQAYTYELELEVAHLGDENAKLRKQQEKLIAAASQGPKLRGLHRTLSSPF